MQVVICIRLYYARYSTGVYMTVTSSVTCAAAHRVTSTIALQNALLAQGAVTEDQQQCFICAERFKMSDGVECTAQESDA